MRLKEAPPEQWKSEQRPQSTALPARLPAHWGIHDRLTCFYCIFLWYFSCDSPLGGTHSSGSAPAFTQRGSRRCASVNTSLTKWTDPTVRHANAPQLDRKLLCFWKVPTKKWKLDLVGRICTFLLWRRFEFCGFPDGLNRLMPLLETVPSRNLKIHLAKQRGWLSGRRESEIHRTAGCELTTTAREH